MRSALTILLLGGLMGCGSNPEVPAEHFRLLRGLEAACSARNGYWLRETETEVESAHLAGTLGDREYEKFHAIFDLVRDEQWDKAHQEVRAWIRHQRPPKAYQDKIPTPKPKPTP